MKIIKSGKGQAAIEFLSTYGWMLLIVVAVIGAMTYYGFGNTKNAVPSSCYLGQNFECSSYFVNTKGIIGLEVVNLEKKPIIIDKVLVRYPGEESYLKIDYDDNNDAIPVGDHFILFIDPTSTTPFNDLSFNGKDKFEIRLVYNYDEQGALTKSSSGELIGDIVNDDEIAYQYSQESNLDIDSKIKFTP